MCSCDRTPLETSFNTSKTHQKTIQIHPKTIQPMQLNRPAAIDGPPAVDHKDMGSPHIRQALDGGIFQQKIPRREDGPPRSEKAFWLRCSAVSMANEVLRKEFVRVSWRIETISGKCLRSLNSMCCGWVFFSCSLFLVLFLHCYLILFGHNKNTLLPQNKYCKCVVRVEQKTITLERKTTEKSGLMRLFRLDLNLFHV